MSASKHGKYTIYYNTACPLGYNSVWHTWKQCALWAGPEVLHSVAAYKVTSNRASSKIFPKTFFIKLFKLKKRFAAEWRISVDMLKLSIFLILLIAWWLAQVWPATSRHWHWWLLVFAHERQQASVLRPSESFSMGWAFHSGWISSGLRCVAGGKWM